MPREYQSNIYSHKLYQNPTHILNWKKVLCFIFTIRIPPPFEAGPGIAIQKYHFTHSRFHCMNTITTTIKTTCSKMVAIAVRMIIVLANVFVVSKSSIESCQCQIHNATLALVNNNLQFIEDQHYPYRISRLKTASHKNTVG